MSDRRLMRPQAVASDTVWRRAVAQCRGGTPRHLLDLLLAPVLMDGQDRPLQMHALPDDHELRGEIVEALLHIGRFGARLRLSALWMRENIGTPRERAHEAEVAAAAALASISGKKAIVSMAAAVGVEPETLARRIRDRRKRR